MMIIIITIIYILLYKCYQYFCWFTPSEKQIQLYQLNFQLLMSGSWHLPMPAAQNENYLSL